MEICVCLYWHSCLSKNLDMTTQIDTLGFCAYQRPQLTSLQIYCSTNALLVGLLLRSLFHVDISVEKILTCRQYLDI